MQPIRLEDHQSIKSSSDHVYVSFVVMVRFSVSNLERLKDGNIHMCFFSRSGYRPFINPAPSLGNLLLDITICSISFRCRFVFLLILGLGLGSVIGLGFRVRVRDQVRDR